MVCLDSIGADSSKLYAHVSKPPKNDSANALILKVLLYSSNYPSLASNSFCDFCVALFFVVSVYFVGKNAVLEFAACKDALRF